MERDYTAFVMKDDDGYTVVFPDLPGCMTVAETFDKAFSAARDVLSGYLNTLCQEGMEIPEPRPFDTVKSEDEDRAAVVGKIAVPASKTGKRTGVAITMYPAVIESGDDGGFGAFFPDLPGCAAAGDTIEECKIDATEALILHLAGMMEDGEALPEPTPVAEVAVDSDVQVEEIVLISASLEAVAANRRLSYPVDLIPDESGRMIARVPDLVGCVTDGADSDEALAEAAGALEAALCAAMAGKEAIPLPSPSRGRPAVAPKSAVATRIARYVADFPHDPHPPFVR